MLKKYMLQINPFLQASLDFSFLSFGDCFTSFSVNDCAPHSVNVRKDPETELLLAMAHKLKKACLHLIYKTQVAFFVL